MTKNLYKGTFNYAGHTFRLFSHSTNKEKAYLNFTNQLSKRLKVGKRTILFAFDGSKDNYKVEEVRR